MLLLTNIHLDIVARMGQFMAKIMFMSCCLKYCSQFLMVLHTLRLFQQIFEINKLIISLLLLLLLLTCKHVSVLQIAQQDPKLQKKEEKKNFLVNIVRKLTAARESWHYFFNRHSFNNIICEFEKFKPCC